MSRSHLIADINNLAASNHQLFFLKFTNYHKLISSGTVDWAIFPRTSGWCFLYCERYSQLQVFSPLILKFDFRIVWFQHRNLSEPFSYYLNTFNLRFPLPWKKKNCCYWILFLGSLLISANASTASYFSRQIFPMFFNDRDDSFHEQWLPLDFMRLTHFLFFFFGLVHIVLLPRIESRARLQKGWAVRIQTNLARQFIKRTQEQHLLHLLQYIARGSNTGF